jgi:hypothetical protein
MRALSLPKEFEAGAGGKDGKKLADAAKTSFTAMGLWTTGIRARRPRPGLWMDRALEGPDPSTSPNVLRAPPAGTLSDNQGGDSVNQDENAPGVG